MIDVEKCKELVLEKSDGRFDIGDVLKKDWGYVVGWNEPILGSGPALVDGETGYVYITNSQRKKQDEILEFGVLMGKLSGKSIEQKERAWQRHYKTFEIIPYF